MRRLRVQNSIKEDIENAQRIKIKQMQLMLLCLFSGWKFENISKTHGGKSQTKVTHEKYFECSNIMYFKGYIYNVESTCEF